MLKLLFASAVSLPLIACSLAPYNLVDPQNVLGIGPDPEHIVKSLKCEIVTFIEENKIRSAIQALMLSDVQNSFLRDPQRFQSLIEVYNSYKSINIDATRFTGLFTEFKNINSLSATIGADWKYPSHRFPTSRSITDHIGASYTDTATYDFTVPLAISQNASLGPSENHSSTGAKPPLASKFSTSYFEQPEVDASFYCYKSLSNLKDSTTIFDAANDVQNLILNSEGWRDYANFDRVYVGQQTLAHWLQTSAIAISSNSKTIFPTSENVFIGQLSYYFILDVKPGADLKYTLVGKIANPIIPSVSASIDHSATFSIYINTQDVQTVLNSKVGNSQQVIPDGFYRRILSPKTEKPRRTTDRT